MRLNWVYRSLGTIVVAAQISGTAYASCDDIYRDSTRDLYTSASRISAYFALYDKICTSSGEIRSDADSSSVSLAYEDISGTFGKSGKSQRETVSAFCHDYRMTRYSDSYKNIASSTVVKEALNDYNVCREAELREGVDISHTFVQPDGIIFSFQFRNQTTVLEVSSVLTYNFSCTSADASSNGSAINIGSKKVAFRSNFSIVCKRDYKTEYDDNGHVTPIQPMSDSPSEPKFVFQTEKTPAKTDTRRVFSAGSVGISTNFGTYTVSMPADEQYPNELASEATARLSEATTTIHALQTANDGLTRSLDAANTKLSGIYVDPFLVVIGQYGAALATQHFGCGTSLNTAEIQICGNQGKNRIKVIGNYGGGQCGYTWALVSCLRAPR